MTAFQRSAELTDPAPPPFALLRREGRDVVEVLTGTVDVVERLADIPVPALALVPYRQGRGRGFAPADDGAPPGVLRPSSFSGAPLRAGLPAPPGTPPPQSAVGFDVPD